MPATDSVDITITLSDGLAPNLSFADAIGSVTAFSFSDGVQTITDATPGAILTFFNAIDTDASGNIIGWNAAVEISGGDFFIDSSDTVWDEGCFTSVSFCDSSARVAFDPGTWQVVPEPATAALAGLGLAALAIGSRRRRAG